MLTESIIDGSTTHLRGILGALLDLTGLLAPWQRDVARLRLPQAHYTYWEQRQIYRVILEHHRSGALKTALDRRRNANSPENIQRAARCIDSHAGHGSNKTGNFWCPICNTGKNIYYRVGKGRMAGMCQRPSCVRVLLPALEQDERTPHFANIIPQDIGDVSCAVNEPENLG